MYSSPSELAFERSKGTSDLPVTAFAHSDAPVGIVVVSYPLELQLAFAIFEHDTVVANHLAVEWLQGEIQ